MGWTVLYIAFGIVALWLLGEVLLQYKARLRWRLLAFFGFLGVILGVLMPSVTVIAVGATAFAVGQTYVTLSYRRGFSAGWVLGGRPGSSRRRKSGSGPKAAQPVPETAEAPEGPQVFPSEPMPDETDQYAAYRDFSPGDGTGVGGADRYDYHGDHSGYGQDSRAGEAGQSMYPGPYDYGTAPCTAYTAPYAAPYADVPSEYGGYDSSEQQYRPEEYAADPYPATSQYDALAYDMDTPPGGIWVPQQRGSEQPPAEFPAPDPQPYPYPTGHPGHEDPYRY